MEQRAAVGEGQTIAKALLFFFNSLKWILKYNVFWEINHFN